MRQSKSPPAELLPNRTPWEDREDEPDQYGDDGGVDCWGWAAEQDAQAEPEGNQQRQDQHHRVPAEPDAPLNQTTEKPSYATPAVNDGDQHDGDR